MKRQETLGLRATADQTARIFRLFEEGEPDLVDLGIPPIRKVIGGFFPGTLIGIAMPTGVGKSNLALSMLLSSADRGGLISTEDGPDVLGARILSQATGISSLQIRKKDLSPAEVSRLEDAIEHLTNDEGPCFRYPIGGQLEDVEEAAEALAEEGCRYIILDYLQKVRGGGDDRRNEVGRVMTTFHRVCAKHHVVPVMISQLVRMERTKAPQVHHLKESGDIENECRVIILGSVNPENESEVLMRVAKSTFGGAGLRFTYRYDEAGTLSWVDREAEASDDF